MKAVVFHGPGQKSWERVDDPKIQQDQDAILRITTATICGTDLHILKGDVPEVRPGTVLGHEAVGIVEEIGSGVTNLRKGDRVLVPAITADGRCDFCRIGMYSHCRNGGWVFGHLIDGLQAEYARAPYADTVSIPSLLTLIQARRFDPTLLASHTFPLAEVMTAYDVFSRAGETGALKVVLKQ
jgi:alcohol dehydrogenase